VFLSIAAPLRKYSSADSGPLPFIAKRISRIRTIIVSINSEELRSMFFIFTKMIATIIIGIITIDDIFVKRPTVIKRPHNNENVVTRKAKTRELREKTPMPVCSIIDSNLEISIIKFIPFQIIIMPNTILKMVSKDGWLTPGLRVVGNSVIKNYL
jgi:hypothetical protein